MEQGPHTITEVAEFLRVPPGTIRYLIRMGALAAISFPGGHMLIERSAITDFIERHRQPAKAKDAETV